MWQTTTSPPWRRRRARAWVRRSSRSNWLASPVCGSAMESCQSWSYWPRGGPPAIRRVSGPAALNLLQHRLDALGSSPHGRAARGRPVAALRLGLRAHRPARRVRPRQVSSWLASRCPPPIQTSHSYRYVRVPKQSRKSSDGLQTCAAAGQAATMRPTQSTDRSLRCRGPTTAGTRWTRSDQGKRSEPGSASRPPALTSAPQPPRRCRTAVVAASAAGPSGPAPLEHDEPEPSSHPSPAEKTSAPEPGPPAGRSADDRTGHHRGRPRGPRGAGRRGGRRRTPTASTPSSTPSAPTCPTWR